MIPNFRNLGDNGSAYVANMSHSAHIDFNGVTTIEFLAPVVAGTDLLALMTVAASTNYPVDVEVAEAFGRNLQVLSTDAGDLTIIGKDFLGQVMSETITCTVGTVATLKAFAYITEFRASAGLAGNITLKAGPKLGLPFCAVKVMAETVDGLTATNGTMVAAVSTTPTDTTGDVRGVYTPNTTLNGVKNIGLTYLTTAKLIGGLYGQPQA